MGIGRPAIRFLARQHKRRPFTAPVLTLGRQGVAATLEEARALLAAEGLCPAQLPAGLDPRTNIPGWHGTWNERFISDAALFALLGLSDVKALDCSDYEKPDLVADLNRPVPEQLKGRFSLILDGGTLEHVFDVRQAVTNVGDMLREQGRVLHILPMDNYVNHGFYQFSPTFFYDYYSANAFTDLEGFVAVESRGLDAWQLYRLDETAAAFDELASDARLLCVFSARKAAGSSTGKVPAQGRYQRDYLNPPAATFRQDTASLKARLARRMPKGLEALIRRYLLPYDPSNRLPYWLRVLLIRWVPGLDPGLRSRLPKEPWGLKSSGRLD